MSRLCENGNKITLDARAGQHGQLACTFEARFRAEMCQLQDSALCTIVAHIAISGARIEMLDLSLDLISVGYHSWLQLFIALPFLETLYVCDTSIQHCLDLTACGSRCANGAQGVFHALSATTNPLPLVRTLR